MSATSLRAAGQLRNETELLVDAVVITRPGELTGEPDPETGLETDATPVQVWSGLAWLKFPSGSSMSTVGGDVVAVQRPTLAIPLSAPRLAIGDSALITDSAVALNVGRTVRITGLPGGSFVTLARYEVEEVI